MSLSSQLVRVRNIIAPNCFLQNNSYPECTLFFSVSDGDERAKVIHVSATSFEAAWKEGVSQLRKVMLKHKLEGKWLRVDWITGVEELTWKDLGYRLKGCKRNYFRYGLALDEKFKRCFLEQELNANAMLYQGAKIPYAELNIKNFNVYAKSRYRDLADIDFSDGTKVYILSIQGVFFDAKECYELVNTGLEAGRRNIHTLTADHVLELVNKGSHFLSNQVEKNGKFNYGYFPCFDRSIGNYNTLRHASSTYSMIEAWELCQSEALFHAIERSLKFLVKFLIKRVELKNGQQAAFLIDTGNEIKLGGNAVCLLALVKYSEVTQTRKYDKLLDALAVGIAEMQDVTTGQFVHVLNYPDLSVKEVFRIIYYDGEAAFGLIRLYQLTKNERWLNIVEGAFVYFIARQHWKAHDHWLSYCVNELTNYRPEERYFRFGLQNVSGYLDFILQRETTFPTLLELVMAAEKMLRRIDSLPDMQHLLLEIDVDQFYKALHSRAHQLLNGHFWPEFAMYFKNPERIVNSFFIRHHSFRVRIDDVEHYLSGFVAYQRFLKSNLPNIKAKQLAYMEDAQEWNAANVARVTNGYWIIDPAKDWTMTGVCIAVRTFKPEQIIVVANGVEKWGIPVHLIGRVEGAAAIICSDSIGLEDLGLPVLKVPSCADAVLKLGEYARSQLHVPVFGVTGSAGKTTTCAMLAHVLQEFGGVGQTAFSANLPHGIAWNLASVSWDVANVVMELAIGRMPVNSRLVRPNIAMVMNIAPAHLEYHHTTDEIARKKSAIFVGMEAGGYAVLYHEMKEFPIFEQAAIEKQLKIVTFGKKEGADVRLISYDLASGQVVAQVFDRECRYKQGAPGLHMVLNSLAVVAAIVVSGQQVDKVLSHFESFKPVAGRGSFQKVKIGQIEISLLDETYNANPISMRAMMALCEGVIVEKGRRVIVLGDMLELGAEAEMYHQKLLEPLLKAKPDCVVLCGVLMKSLWQLLPQDLPSYWFESVDRLENEMVGLLQDNDWVAIKSSNGTGLNRLVSDLMKV